MYVIQGKPEHSSTWVVVDALPRPWLEANRAAERRREQFIHPHNQWEYRVVAAPKQVDVPGRKRVTRRNVKKGSIFRYLTGWHKDGIFEADAVHEGRPPLHELGLWDAKSLPLSIQSGSGEMCEILWEPGDPPLPTVAAPTPAPPTFRVTPPVATPHNRREYELGWGQGRSLRPELEDLEDDKLFRLDTEVHAEASRRRLQREELQRVNEHNRRVEWLAVHGERARGQFSSFMLGVAQAMACRTALRKAKGHVPYAGNAPTGGTPWTSEDLAVTSRMLGGMVAPWAVDAQRFKECMAYPAWRQAVGSTLKA